MLDDETKRLENYERPDRPAASGDASPGGVQVVSPALGGMAPVLDDGLDSVGASAGAAGQSLKDKARGLGGQAPNSLGSATGDEGP